MAKRSAKDVDWFDMSEIPYRASRLLKTLGNPKAYALVRLLLAEDVLAVDEMVRALRRPQPVVSQILRALRDLDVVRYQRRGKEVLYTIKDRKAVAAVLDGAETYARRAAAQATETA